jgi:hypothetical protein
VLGDPAMCEEAADLRQHDHAERNAKYANGRSVDRLVGDCRQTAHVQFTRPLVEERVKYKRNPRAVANARSARSIATVVPAAYLRRRIKASAIPATAPTASSDNAFGSGSRTKSVAKNRSHSNDNVRSSKLEKNKTLRDDPRVA